MEPQKKPLRGVPPRPATTTSAPLRRPMTGRPVLTRSIKLNDPMPPMQRNPDAGKAPAAQPTARPLATTASSSTPKLRVIPIGGQEEVGRNMTAIEYGDDIVIIDMGLQFPEEDMPGIDYIIPNATYFKGKEKNIKGVLITHGHYDHIGAVPHLIPALGNPTLYGTPLTLNIIKRRQEDFTHIPSKMTFQAVTPQTKLTLGIFHVEFFHINHNIPQSVGIVVKTPVGTIVHTGDWKFDFNPVGEPAADFQRIAELGKEGVLALMSDSTNAGEPGHQMSEKEIGETMRQIFQDTKGRLIIGTFSSLLSRVQQILTLADQFGRKVAIDGFSMKTNVAILQEMGYLKINKNTLIDVREVNDLPPERVVILGTGAQGEKNAVLMRIANNEHKFLRIQPGDTVIFSSSVVPGNERSVQRLKDTLYKAGAKVIHYKLMDVHAGGHARAEDVKLMINLMKPKYFIPIEGNHFLLRNNADVAESLGMTKANVLVSGNGQVIEFGQDGLGGLNKEFVPSDYVFVDGLGVGDVSNVVLRDRQMMSADGMFIVVTTINKRTGQLVSSPDLISRGFIYMKENKEIIDETRELIKKTLAGSSADANRDPEYIKEKIRIAVGQFLFQKTQRQPMVLAVVIEV